MTGFCSRCGWRRSLDAPSRICVECILQWAEMFKAATKKEGQ